MFLDMNKELLGREIKKTITFKVVSEWIKYLGISLIKNMKELY